MGCCICLTEAGPTLPDIRSVFPEMQFPPRQPIGPSSEDLLVQKLRRMNPNLSIYDIQQREIITGYDQDILDRCAMNSGSRGTYKTEFRSMTDNSLRAHFSEEDRYSVERRTVKRAGLAPKKQARPNSIFISWVDRFCR
jgi:hypothetical protein